MNTQLSHSEIESLLGAYALDAVDPDEANVIEVHLRGCPRCEAEVATFRETAALLAHTGTAAPAGVWDNIVAKLEDRPAPPLAFLPTKAVRSRRWPMITSAAAAIVLVAASVSWAVGRQSSDTRTRGDGLDAAIIAAYADPHATPIRLVSSDGQHRVDAVLLPNGTGFLARNNLPALSGDRTYQLWGNTGTNVVSLGVLGSEPRELAFAAGTKLTALAITEEQAGGVVSSVRPPVVVGVVST
jgi:hypothetical protein